MIQRPALILCLEGSPYPWQRLSRVWAMLPGGAPGARIQNPMTRPPLQRRINWFMLLGTPCRGVHPSHGGTQGCDHQCCLPPRAALAAAGPLPSVTERSQGHHWTLGQLLCAQDCPAGPVLGSAQALSLNCGLPSQGSRGCGAGSRFGGCLGGWELGDLVSVRPRCQGMCRHRSWWFPNPF